ncbi:MAG: AhpC/TSA family protein, partial [Bacteroidota bacterium]
SDFQTADKYFEEYNLNGITHISDPNCYFYKSFGLMKGSFKQLFGLKSWMRGYDAGVRKGVGIGKMLGDGFQMPGVFVIDKKEVREQFIHKYPSDRPDYENLISCCSPA